jgi:hypothetical protein
MLFAKLRMFIHMLCIPRIQNLVTAKLWCRISYQNTKYTIQIMVFQLKYSTVTPNSLSPYSSQYNLDRLLHTRRYFCTVVDMYRYFGEMCCLHHQLTSTPTEAAVFFSRNVRKHVPNYKPPPARRQLPSVLTVSTWKLSFMQCSEKLDTESAAKLGHYESYT